MNTVVLYVRMIFVLLVALYTSRVLLDVLGVEDYGVYNVVGGVVTMLGFFNGAMVSSTQRFFSFAIGQGDIDQLNKNYSTILLIQGGLCLLVILLAETIGLWFVRTYLVIPPDRLVAALWVYHFAIFSFVVSMLQVPYTALLITHERMTPYAYISIGDVGLRLLTVIVLPYVPADKLKVYAILLFVVALITFSVYIIYCKQKFTLVRLIKHRDKGLFRVLLSYMGWNLWGNSAAVILNQGINILLNIFFGPVVNAARAIAYQVNGALTQLVTNFQLAMNPQIVKSYARGDMDYMHSLIYRGAKLSFFLMFVIALPVGLEADTLLGIWLKEVPAHTVLFTRLVLIQACIDSVSGPLMIAAQASGNIKKYQMYVGGLLILNLPVSYVALKLGAPAEAVFFVSIAVAIIALVTRLIIISPLVSLSISSFSSKVIGPVVLSTGLALVISLMIARVINIHSIMFSALTMLMAFLVACIFSYLLGLSRQERSTINNFIRRRK